MPRRSKSSHNSPLRARANRHVPSRSASIHLFSNAITREEYQDQAVNQGEYQNHRQPDMTLNGGLHEAETSLQDLSISSGRPRRGCANYAVVSIVFHFDI